MTNLTEFKPFVVKDVLSQEDYAYVYECVKNAFPEELAPDLPPDNREGLEYLNVPELGYFAYIKGFDNNFLLTIRDFTEDVTGLSLKTAQVHFARYTTKTGHQPELRPHSDNQLKKPSITLSIQLDSTLDWELCAYDTCDTLASNEALVFSGSHQMHWRPPTNFSENDYLDILVCQMSIDGSEYLLPSHYQNMQILQDAELEKYFKKYPTTV
jgi:hypothetical protein